MKTTEGVEWAVHACAVLAGLSRDSSLNAAALAGFHKLPAAYMAKHLQGLVRAGILEASRGGRGGYKLARAPSEISLWDIQAALEGSQPAFKCQNIRRQGPCARYTSHKIPCDIACVFLEAEGSYRAHLKSISVAEIAKRVAAKFGPDGRIRFSEWLVENGGVPGGRRANVS